MRPSAFVAILLVWSLSFQAFAGLAGSPCRHAAPASTSEMATAAGDDAHHKHMAHHEHMAHAERAPTPSLGCDCGCQCEGACIHGCQAGAACPSLQLTRDKPARDTSVAVVGQRLASHSLQLLRPPALL